MAAVDMVQSLPTIIRITDSATSTMGGAFRPKADFPDPSASYQAVSVISSLRK